MSRDLRRLTDASLEVKTPEGSVERTWSGARWPVRPVALAVSADYARKLVDALKTAWETTPLGWTPTDPERLAEHLQRVGGIFAPVIAGQEVEHDLTDKNYIAGLFGAASRVEPNNQTAVTALVSRWGLLRVGPEPFETPSGAPLLPPEVGGLLAGVDSFGATRHELEAFQWALKELARLKRRRRPDEQSAKAWRDFTHFLEERLASLQPTILWRPETGPMPAWTVKTPRDVLWAKLWDLTTRGGQLRRCKHCEAFFLTKNPRQKFCSTTCTNRASAAAWYERKGRALRRGQRKREGRKTR